MLPFLPVFGGGTSRFQPVYVDDIARVVEIIARRDPTVDRMTSGKIIEAGGPEGECSKLVEHSPDDKGGISLHIQGNHAAGAEVHWS